MESTETSSGTFKLVVNKDAERLSGGISALLHEGWKRDGQVFCSPPQGNSNNFAFYYCQVMVKGDTCQPK